MIILSQALKESVETVSKVSDTPNLDAQILLANTLGKSRAWTISHPEYVLTESDISAWQAGLTFLERGVPLPYVIGHWEFYGLDFTVTQDTLIPRPETELLVDLALEWLGERKGRQMAADIGTGTGCIAIAVARNFQDVSFIASDVSLSALRVAKKNSAQHEVEQQIQQLQCRLLPPINNQFDLICANLPYIPSQMLTTLKIYGCEPEVALNGGSDGLNYITQLLETSKPYTKPGTLLLIEIDSSQGNQVRSCANQHFPYADISLHHDLAQNDRVVKIQLPENTN